VPLYITEMSNNGEIRKPGWSLRLHNDPGPEQTVTPQDQHPGSRSEIAELLKHWAMPKLKDELDYDDLRLEWPMWLRMLKRSFEIMTPAGRDWTEAEKYWILLTMGGKHVREVDSYSAPVSGEVGGQDEVGGPHYSNLVKRLNWTFRPRDSATEIALLRRMKQKPDEPIRKFLDKLKRQISLCGFASQETKELELRVALTTITIDSDKILEHSVGASLEQLEARALIQEEIRLGKREKEEKVHAIRETEESSEKKIKLEANEIPSSTKQRQGQQRSRPRGINRECFRCGRRGGHEEGYPCPAINAKCFICERMGHRAAKCPEAGPNAKRPGGHNITYRAPRLENTRRDEDGRGTQAVNKV
jgi:hypothetical protein